MDEVLFDIKVFFGVMLGFISIVCFTVLLDFAFFKYNLWFLCIFIALCCVLLGFIILGIIKFFSTFKITFDIIEKKSKDN